MGASGLIRAAGLALLAAVATAGPAAAQAVPPPHTPPGWLDSRNLASQAAGAEIKGNPADALRFADQALAADGSNAWAHYDRATALARLGQTDQAVQAFQAAEQHFAPQQAYERSISIYGRAHALAQAGRCPEARAAFADYIVFVERADPRSADMARRYAQDCRAKAQ
jgi:tetratricopeptide (TPR) repeat protein